MVLNQLPILSTITLYTMCDTDCRHYKKAMKICSNHQEHHHQLTNEGTKALDGSSAFEIALKANQVNSVSVSHKEYDETKCEWKGCCSLKFLRPLDKTTYLVSDSHGNTYMLTFNQVLAFD